MKIKETYEIVTPESAELGDVEERGFVDEEGVEFRPGNLMEAVEYLEQHYVVYTSSGSFHQGMWYMTSGEHDFRTGHEETRSFHLSDCTRREEKFIARRLQARGSIRGLDRV